MTKDEVIAKLDKLIERAEAIKSQNQFGQDLMKWKRDSDVAIEKIFGENSKHMQQFENVSYSFAVVLETEKKEYLCEGIETATTYLKSMRDEVQEYGYFPKNQSKKEVSPNDNIELIINRFHQVCRQLHLRYNNRSTLDINDEYDVQDLFHALLKLYFDDVRPEEYTPSYAGAASRTDFLLKKEQIIIELKKSRKTLRAKEVGEQLIVDSQRYQAHPDCKRIVCFVYDPEGFIANPKGIENDLSKEMNGIPVSVFIRPE